MLAAGGDGTLGEAANGLVGTDTVLAPLPVGTGNSFGKELRLPRPGLLARHKLLHAAEALAAGRVQQMDLGYTCPVEGENGRFWLLWTGIGVDAILVDEMEPRPKLLKRIGAPGYALQALTQVPKLHFMHATVTIDGQDYSGDYVLILISNCRLYGGGEILLSPQAHLDDGLFEVWLLQGDSVLDTFVHLANLLRGQHVARDAAQRVNGRHVYVQTKPTMPCQTDGDRAGHTPLRVEIRPRAVRMLIPDTAPSDLFSLPGTPLSSVR